MFSLGKGCYSCKYRVGRVGQKIECSCWDDWFWLHLICEKYEPTDDGRILSYADRQIPTKKRSKWLINWLKMSGVVK